MSQSGEAAQDERTTTVYVRGGVALHRRTQYHLSRSRAVLLVIRSVLVFSSRIRILLYSNNISSV